MLQDVWIPATLAATTTTVQLPPLPLYKRGSQLFVLSLTLLATLRVALTIVATTITTSTIITTTSSTTTATSREMEAGRLFFHTVLATLTTTITPTTTVTTTIITTTSTTTTLMYENGEWLDNFLSLFFLLVPKLRVLPFLLA